jgi:hypothetical protein
MSAGGSSNLRTFGEIKGVFNIDAKPTHGALDFGMSQQDLNCPQIARRLVDDRCFGAPK